MSNVVVANFGDFVEEVVVNRGLSSSNPVVNKEAVDAVAVGDVCVVINNTVYLADSTNLAHIAKNKLICINGGLSGEIVTLQAEGQIELVGWGLTVDLPVFLGPAGSVVAVPPTTGFIQTIGVPITSDVLDIEIGMAVKL